MAKCRMTSLTQVAVVSGSHLNSEHGRVFCPFARARAVLRHNKDFIVIFGRAVALNRALDSNR